MRGQEAVGHRGRGRQQEVACIGRTAISDSAAGHDAVRGREGIRQWGTVSAVASRMLPAQDGALDQAQQAMTL